MPVIDDQLDQLSSKKYYTKFDLKDAFYNIKLTEDSWKSVLFVTYQYEFTRAFGYCNSPAGFARYINKVFKILID